MLGWNIQEATGEGLDIIAEIWGIKRRNYWLFRESDKKLRRRIHIGGLSVGPAYGFKDRAAGVGFWRWLHWRVNMWVN